VLAWCEISYKSNLPYSRFRNWRVLAWSTGLQRLQRRPVAHTVVLWAYRPLQQISSTTAAGRWSSGAADAASLPPTATDLLYNGGRSLIQAGYNPAVYMRHIDQAY